jgi:hypothetical protein
MKKIILSLISLILVSCASSIGDRTIASMDDVSKPDWANQQKSVTTKDGKIRILGFNEVSGDAKISAAFRLSDNTARSELSKMIENNLSTITQNLEEGVTDEGGMTRTYSSEVSKSVIRELPIVHRYWEKVLVMDAEGEKNIRLRTYSMAEIPESKFKKLIKEKLDKDKIDPEVKKQVLNHFEAEIKDFRSN